MNDDDYEILELRTKNLALRVANLLYKVARLLEETASHISDDFSFDEPEEENVQ